MKYLVVSRRSTPAAEHQSQIRFLETANNWVNNRMKDGTVEAAYSFATGGGFFIINAESNEELMQILVDFPLRPLAELDIDPITEFTKATKITIDAIRKYSG
jgi:hypothetical protein